MPKKTKELKYEAVDRVSRWNYIQFISREILNSGVSNDQLKQICLDLQSGVFKLELQITEK